MLALALFNQVIFFFPCRGLWTVLLWENRLGQIVCFSFFCAAPGGKAEMLVWFSLSQYTKSLTFLLTSAAYMRVGMLLSLPLPYWKATPVTLKPVKTTWKQTQNQAQKETDIRLCWFLLLLNSGRTELGCTTQTIFFSAKITCTTLLSPSYCIKQAPSETKRGGLLMPQLRDGAYINHVTSSFLNAWKSSLSEWKKELHMPCSEAFVSFLK